jgi:hypothetical protein
LYGIALRGYQAFEKEDLMKRLATIALAVLFVTSLSNIVMADRAALAIGGKLEIMAAYEENIGAVQMVNIGGGVMLPRAAGIGDATNDNRVEQKVNVDIDADMADNVSVHIGLEQSGAWGNELANDNPFGGGSFATAGYSIDDQAVALNIDEAYVMVKELFIEQLTAKAGVQSVEYSLRNDGNAMFLSVPEIGAWKTTLNYDPLYVDVVIGKMIETRTTHGDNDQDLFALAVEYYLENKGKVQVVLFNVADENDEVSVTEYSAGVTYMVIEDLEVFVQLGGQSGEVMDGVDAGCMAYNLGCEYTFSKINRKPYVGISYQYFGGDDADANWVNYGDVDETIVLEADRNLRDHNRGPNPKILTDNYSVIRIVGGCVIDDKTSVDAGIGMFSVVDDGSAYAGLLNPNGETAIGTEIDVKASYKLTDDLVISGGIGYLASGDVIEETGGETEAVIVGSVTATLNF